MCFEGEIRDPDGIPTGCMQREGYIVTIGNIRGDFDLESIVDCRKRSGVNIAEECIVIEDCGVNIFGFYGYIDSRSDFHADILYCHIKIDSFPEIELTVGNPGGSVVNFHIVKSHIGTFRGNNGNILHIAEMVI